MSLEKLSCCHSWFILGSIIFPLTQQKFPLVAIDQENSQKSWLSWVRICLATVNLICQIRECGLACFLSRNFCLVWGHGGRGRAPPHPRKALGPTSGPPILLIRSLLFAITHIWGWMDTEGPKEPNSRMRWIGEEPLGIRVYRVPCLWAQEPSEARDDGVSPSLCQLPHLSASLAMVKFFHFWVSLCHFGGIW